MHTNSCFYYSLNLKKIEEKIALNYNPSNGISQLERR